MRRVSCSPEGWGYCTTVRRTHSVFASVVLFVISAWLSGGLTRHALRELADSSLVARYLDSSVLDSWRSSPRTSLAASCEVSNWAPGSSTQNSTVFLSGVSPAQQVPSVSGLLSPVLPRSSPLTSDPSAVSSNRVVPPASCPAWFSGSGDHGVLLVARPILDWCCNFNAVCECRWYEFAEDSCDVTSIQKDHCTAGQIARTPRRSQTPQASVPREMAMTACVRCPPFRRRVATGHASGLCVNSLVLFFLSPGCF